MNDYPARLKRIGNVLIIIGILDVLVMILCIVLKVKYSSSLNIFAVIGGVLLRRGGLKTARIITNLSAFGLGASLVLLLLALLMTPFGLMAALLRLKPLSTAAGTFLALVMPAFLAWLFHALRAPEIRAAMEQNGVQPRRLTVPAFFACGLLLAAALGGMTAYLLKKNPIGAQVRAEARRRLGPGYEVAVSALNVRISGGKTMVAAIVTGYNANVIQSLKIAWEDPPGPQAATIRAKAVEAAPIPASRAIAQPPHAPPKPLVAPAPSPAQPKAPADSGPSAEAVFDACTSELGLLCGDARGNDGKLRCLRQYEDSLMKPCRQALSPR